MFDFLKQKSRNISICRGQHGAVRMKDRDRFANMLILGCEGCGKTSSSMLPMIMQNLKNTEWGLTVIETRDNLSIKAHFLAQRFGRKSLYFNPTSPHTPKFNPLSGPESDVVENIATTFRLLNPDSPQYFLDLSDLTIRNSIKVLKRLDRAEGVDGKYANLICLDQLLQNANGEGSKLVNQFCNIQSGFNSKENKDIAKWFVYCYFPNDNKIYADTSCLRAQVNKLVSNEYLRRALNPDFAKGEKNEIDFSQNLADGNIICISTAEYELRELARFLNYFIIFAFQSAIRNRPTAPFISRPHAVYIDNFSHYANFGIFDILERSYQFNTSFTYAVRALAHIAYGMREEKRDIAKRISSVTGNAILYPGIIINDAKFYNENYDTSAVDLFFGKAHKKNYCTVNYYISKNDRVQPFQTGYVRRIPEKLRVDLENEIMQYILSSKSP